MRPAEIAREAFRQLAVRRINPTPEAYGAIYNEIAGITQLYSSENVLLTLSASLRKSPGNLGVLGEKLSQASVDKDWQEYTRLISELTDKFLLKKADTTLARSPTATQTASPHKINETLEVQLSLLKEMLSKSLKNGFANNNEIAKEAQSLAEAVKEVKTETKLFELSNRLKQLCYKAGLLEDEQSKHQSERIPQVKHPTNSSRTIQESNLLRDMLVRILNSGLPTALHNFKDLNNESSNLAKMIKNSTSDARLNDIASKVKQLCYRINIAIDINEKKNIEEVQSTEASTKKELLEKTQALDIEKKKSVLLKEILLQLNTSLIEASGSNGSLNDEAKILDDLSELTTLNQLELKTIQLKQFSSILEKLFLKNGTNGTTNVAATGLAHKPQLADNESIIRSALVRTLGGGLTHFLHEFPDLMDEINSLTLVLQDKNNATNLPELEHRIKELCFTASIKSEEKKEQFDLLLELYRLLLKNINELVDENTWLNGQVVKVQQLLNGKIDINQLEETIRCMKEIIYKQGVLKHSHSEAKASIKNMIVTFIERLDTLLNSTDEYYSKVTQYTHEISETNDPILLTKILEKLIKETDVAKNEAMRSREEILTAKKFVAEAEEKIEILQMQLAQMSELVMEDSLTGSLNRRGIDDLFEKELARADRKKTPICIALLDLDDFKKLNDTHGHLVGDQVLIHLVRIVKETLRTIDVIGRFGGEEFLILLPDTRADDAVRVVTRLQRELTKNIFMFNNQGLLITFSAGIAEHINHEEDQTSLVNRADMALYKAKAQGKNRIIIAE